MGPSARTLITFCLREEEVFVFFLTTTTTKSLPKTPISSYLIGRQRPSGKHVPSFAVEPALVDTGRPEACAARLRFGLL